ncbi:MAG: N-6 DNA methylase [Candidatus Nanohaloarchaea archaeon]
MNVEEIQKYEEVEGENHNFLKTLEDIRNYVASHEEGITRDQTISEQMINILFTKVESEERNDDLFRSDREEDIGSIFKDYFEKKVKNDYSEVFNEEDEIRLSSSSLEYIKNALGSKKISDLDRDILGDAFEFFITPALKGSQGQFFTPDNTVELLTSIINPQPGDKVIDPACGTGTFLAKALIESANGKKSHDLSDFTGDEERCEVYGMDKDEFLSKVARARTSLIDHESSNIFCENSLAKPEEWNNDEIELGSFDIVLANPPFGAGQKIKDNETLEQYDLSYKWKKGENGWERTNRTLNTTVQVLFIERCLQLLKKGGKIGIVLPESLFGSPSYRYIMEYLRNNTEIWSVMAMPEDLFEPYTHAKTCLLIAEKKENPKEDYEFFMASANWCGKDSRGNPTIKEFDGKQYLLDDLPLIKNRFEQIKNGEDPEQDNLGFLTSLSSIENNIFVPRYYDPEFENSFEKMEENYDLVQFGDLIDDQTISLGSGCEVGKINYGTGDIPFIRTSDIANWEIKVDPQHRVSEDIYEEYKSKADLEAGDILLVKDGTSLIGTSCMITEHDTKILYQSHLYRVRVEDEENLDPYLLFYALNHPVVQEQIKARQFNQQIIDSLSKKRLREVLLPLPKTPEKKEEVRDKMKEIVDKRAELRKEAEEVMSED